MVAHIEKHKGFTGRYRATDIRRRFNNVRFVTVGNKNIALVSNRLLPNNITQVQMHEYRKTPIHKQHMMLMSGKVPKSYTEYSQTYRVFKITESCIDSHDYEIYEVVNIH